ncbi:predicted protein [Arabidopsis lyrata subsp. lyrata]|uniref:Predicted protein n=1 Tax=Arabidopsis lyrata subsp. lyrata TaxID=81972 RepID=D7LJA6_ARALL|nr:predicted protein [Arabidopsis lyrata subsp. lyrata]
MKEKYFIIWEQKKAENVLVRQACILQSNLQNATSKDNASLHQKIEDKLSADIRKVIDNYQFSLGGSAECSSVAQGKLEYACLEEVSALTTSSACSIDEFLASGDETTVSLFDELQSTLSSHQGEMVLFARELRQRFHTTQEMFEYTSMFFQKLMEESKNSESRVAEANNTQSKSDTDKLIADLTNLVSNFMISKMPSLPTKIVLHEHVSAVNNLTNDAKIKRETFSIQAEDEAREGADFSAAKHKFLTMFCNSFELQFFSCAFYYLSTGFNLFKNIKKMRILDPFWSCCFVLYACTHHLITFFVWLNHEDA